MLLFIHFFFFIHMKLNFRPEKEIHVLFNDALSTLLFIFIFVYLSRPLLHHLWVSGWNEKCLNLPTKTHRTMS